MARTWKGVSIVGWTAASALMVMTAAGAANSAPLNLTIGSLLESTGPLSELGPPSDKAVHLAVTVANEAAKKAGVDMKVNLVSADTQGDAQAALSAARLLADKGASCMMGPDTTPESIAILNGVTMQKKITLWPLATSVALRKVKDDGTIFRTVAADDLQSKALVRAIEDEVGKGKKVVVIYRNEPYGAALAASFNKDWKAAGGTIDTIISFDPDQASFDSEAAKAVGYNPDAYVVIDYPDTFAKLGAALVRTGKFDAKKMFVADALSFAKVPSNIPPQAMAGAYGVAGGTPTGTQAYKTFVKMWNAAGGVENASYTANTFDAGILCFLSAVEAHSTAPGAIRDNVRTVTKAGAPQFTIDTLAEAVKTAYEKKPIDYVGVSGEFRFMANGDPSTSLYNVFQYQNGKQVVVEQVNVK